MILQYKVEKSMGGIRTNETEGITTQNIVLKEIFRNPNK